MTPSLNSMSPLNKTRNHSARDSPGRKEQGDSCCVSSLRPDSLAYSLTDDESDFSSDPSDEGFETFINDDQFEMKKVVVVFGDAFKPQVDEEMLEKVKSIRLTPGSTKANDEKGFRRQNDVVHPPRRQRLRQNSGLSAFHSAKNTPTAMAL